MNQELPTNELTSARDLVKEAALLTVPSIRRALQGISLAFQAILIERYNRLLPILLLFLKPRDILERNRTWAGVSPRGKAATKLLTRHQSRSVLKRVEVYAANHAENVQELVQLLRAYCRYGPVGLIEALPSNLPPLIPDELQECADFYRLAKHPRSDAGIYIRDVLDRYSDALGYQRLPAFVSRYAWATDRKIEQWFFSESDETELIAKTTKRLNLDQSYPHQRWVVRIAPLQLRCNLSRRHEGIVVEPWLIWIVDEHVQTLMGFRICSSRPKIGDILQALRWSIWHYGAPRWKARGVPEELIVHAADIDIPDEAKQALAYLHCNIKLAAPASVCTYVGLPNTFDHWISSLAEMIAIPGRPRLTLFDIADHLMDYLVDTTRTTLAINQTSILIGRDVSLPWESGIASALLLPSAGVIAVQDGKVWPFGVPFCVAEDDIQDGKLVDVRYDPSDARHVHLIFRGAHVRRASAFAFEHRIAWIELVNDPAILVGATLQQQL